MDLEIGTRDIMVRLGIAIFLGGALGFEREWHRKPAGLRTHMMVALGSTTFTLVALELFARVASLPADSLARVDPMRLLEGIIGGIGFLGAGSIIQGRGSVEGLTTAGSLWFVGAVGVAVGGGHYVIATCAVVAALLVLVGMEAVKRALVRER